ncbi:ABC transporter substrate-binding protein [Pseudomonas syringae]|uniref:ABC transporter substrate-binding protein n=1 Tax=Pseudomonas TaxID=286 RepID=UPI001CFC3ED6|nr:MULTISPECIES: ABC transporter substrate-binding protein [Pseudomonas]MCF9000921.1 ABC transporter substrate-binding protein [Pseudomonas syringae]MCL6305370.1 ABC transporter substrate-binding protein [Pseudomonas syringae]MDF7793323.1 ABC transporter substrate-binding protein [Pseudomonas syringae]
MKPLVRSLLASALLLAAGSVTAQDLRIGYADPVSSLDPQLNNYAGDRSVALHAFESLVSRRDDKTLPGLAKSWKVVDDTTWEFALRDDVKWQDGTPLTADDLVFSFERARNVPGSVASYAGAMRTVESVKAKDDHTLIIKTRSPNANLLPDIDSIYIVSRHTGAAASSADYNSGKAMIGTGPYRFVSFVPGDRTIFARNDNYWGGRPTWDKVDFRFIANAANRTAALLAGDVDVIDKVSPTDVARLRKTPNVNVFAYQGLRALIIQPSFRAGPNEFIRDNAGKPLAENPLLDVRVRKALSLAINRPAINERIMQGTVTEANQWMPANTFGYNPQIKNIPYDVKQAKDLLAQAGFPEGFQLTVHVPGDRYPQAPEVMQAVAQFWTRIGVKVQLEVLPWAVYAGKANKNELAISVIAWGNGTGEAAYALTNILTTVDSSKGQGASNWGHYSNPLVDKALADSTAEFDEAKRRKILQDSVQIVSDDVGIIPLFHYQNIWAARKGLKVEPLVSDRTAATMVTEQP